MPASLDDIAFGSAPGTHPLPAARTPHEHWLRAVALGGQGRYAAARAELDEVDRRAAHPVLASLAASTRGSLLRQLGWHALAAPHDGRALAVLGSAANEAAAGARCDALTGLAADALGCGRLSLGFRLLERVAGIQAGFPGSSHMWRQRIRLHWVTAEMSLASGDPDRAQREAMLAVQLADASESVRHRVKSALLAAAALSAGPRPADAAEPARLVLEQCGEHDLTPLRWAAAMLLAGVAPESDLRAVREDCESQIEVGGGRFRVP